ncbi:MAG: aminotransferase class III-fold pyridoxal phosphate-dependent enzyme [Bacteroidetes bacterium]|nr:aminotransferase class III-fold pyridoxal phosphate-dependent enzyme [Bacteroidota bacterium]
MEEVISLVKDVFDINISNIKVIDGDVNYSSLKYSLKDESGNRYVLKIYPDEDELLLAQEESRIFNEIGSSLTFKVPQTIPTPQKSLFFNHEKGKAKLQQYIEGDLLADVQQTPELLHLLGEKIGELTLQLNKVKSPVLASRKLFWDVQNAPLSYFKIDFIEGAERRKWVRYFFDRFEHNVIPVLHELRQAIVHGDVNDRNVLVKNGEVEGILDLGDSTHAPIMFEISTAMAYAMMNKQNAFKEVIPMLKGYNKMFPLKKAEVELLADAITATLCISVCNSSEKRHFQEGTEYDLLSEKPAWDLLEKWITINPVFVTNTFLTALGFEINDAESKRSALLESRKKVTSDALSISYDPPIYMTSSAFQYMFDGLGNTYLDMCNNIPHVGHSHPLISKAISNQTRMLNTNTIYLYDEFTDYAEKLLSYFPSQLNKVFMVNSGSAATDLALRIARTHTKRSKITILESGYHGNSTLGIEISSYKFDGKGGQGAGASVIKLPLPNMYNGTFNTADEYVQDAIERIKTSIAEGETPCAFIGEMILGCGGQVPLAPGYMKALNQFLQENGILTIADEVQTGFGRLGKWFWAFEMHDFIPDIVVLGKPIGNGHPIGAVVTTSEIADGFANGMEFFSSFGGNPVSCAVAHTVLHIIEEEKLQENAKVVGEALKDKLVALQSKHQCMGDVRGEGLFLGIEFTSADGTPDSAIASKVKNELKEQFILVGTDGPNNNVLKIKPPLCFDLNNANEFIAKLDGILSA